MRRSRGKVIAALRGRRVTGRPPAPAKIAERFANDLMAGRRPSIEVALDDAPRDEWSDLLRALLAAEVNARRARGETPLAREYLPRFPAHTDVVLSVLPEPSAPTTAPVTIVAPLPIPLTRPVSGPLPQAIVLPARPQTAAAPKPESTTERPSRQRLWTVAGFFLIGLALIVVFSLPKQPTGSDADPQPSHKYVQVGSSKRIVSIFNPKAPPSDPDRDLAEWVTALGGHGTLLLGNGGRRTFGDEVRLPKEKFTVTGLTLPAESAPLWSEEDLERMRGRTSLTSIQLHHPTAISDGTLKPLMDLKLTTLELHGMVHVTGPTLARFGDLESLALMSALAFNDDDLSHVAKLPKLRSFALNTYHLTPKGIAQLKNPELRSILFGEHVRLGSDHIRFMQALPLEEFESHAGMSDDVFLEFAVFPKLKRIRLRGTSLTDDGLKAVRGLGHLEELRIIGSEITGPGLEHLEDRTELRVLDLSGGQVQDSGIEFIVMLPALREVRLAGCPITDQGVTVLSQIEGLQTLDLSNTAITDVSVKNLRKHPTLKELILINTHASVDWIRDFERTTPNCRVVWSPRK